MTGSELASPSDPISRDKAEWLAAQIFGKRHNFNISSPNDILSHDQAECLAAQILGKRRPHETEPSKTAPNLSGKGRYNRRRAEELAAEIFGRTVDFKAQRQAGREKQKRARRRAEEVQMRCWDWVLHEGNVHYAVNGSSFATYTKLDPANSERLGMGLHGAIGIGTVNLVATRALGGPEGCTITLYDVLHVPSMRFNGIAIPRLIAAEADVLRGEGRSVATHGKAGAQLFEARMMVGVLTSLHRVCFSGEPEMVLPTKADAGDGEDEEVLPVHSIADADEVRLIGSSARALSREEYEVRTISGEKHGVAC